MVRGMVMAYSLMAILQNLVWVRTLMASCYSKESNKGQALRCCGQSGFDV
jgi:hypothetical protein